MSAGASLLGGLAFAALKLLVAALLGAALAVVVFGVASNPRSFVNRAYARYVSKLERSLRAMFIATPGRSIVVGQGAALFVVLALGVAFSIPFFWVAIPVVLLGPSWYVEWLRRQRVKLVEAKLEPVVVALANALKTTPSLGNALGYAQPLMPPPMFEEFALALKEVRVGVTVEQSLMNMCTRIRSAHLDAAMAGLLIGRQVGGDLPRILETIAQTLREMGRLQGMLRAKTADGRAQIGVLTFLPVLLLIGFDTVKPGYFAPLTASFTGYVIMAVAGSMWASAILIARKLLKVEI